MTTSLAPVAIKLAALGVIAATLAACSTEDQMRAQDPAVQGTAASADADSMPDSVPPADGEVRTASLVTVLDEGDGPRLCLGPVAQSLPPQCSGLPVTGWDWATHPEHEEAAGVKWGSFVVTGTFDGTALAATGAIPAALYDAAAEEPEEPLGTPCKGPVEVTDAAKATPEALDATMNSAATLPDLAMTWLDGGTINVAVTDDVAGAETKLRETWGGGLCVSTAEHTQRELEAIQTELNTLPGLLTAGSDRPDHLQVTVVHDDGSLQAWADDEYDGLVGVTSALVPAS